MKIRPEQRARTPRSHRPVAEGAITLLARLLVGVFFRDLEVTGRDAVPDGGPVVLVANHQNGLVDGLVLITACDRFPRFIGKSTLWRIGPLRPFLALAGVVPVRRASDTRGSISEAERRSLNDVAFASCRQALAEGGLIAVFPEGISHDEAFVQELRSGTARIALGAAAEDGVSVVLAAAGLAYDDKTRFRSRALVSFASPRAVEPYVDSYRVDPAATVRRLTADIATDLIAAAPDYPSMKVADELRQIAELVVGAAQSGEPPLSRVEVVARALGQVDATAAGGPVVEALRSQAAGYRASLALLGLTDAQLVGSAGRRATQVGWTMAKTALGFPVAAAGVAVHIAPFLIVKQLARLPRNESIKATVKVLASALAYTVCYLVIGVVVGRRRGWWAGLVALVAAPLSGVVALLGLEWVDRVEGIRRAATTVRDRQMTVKELMSRRATIVEATRRALGPAGPPSGEP